MKPFPAIDDHGLIGDLQTSALVAVDGTIDWFCSPRFDSPSVFASLLDVHRGGHFSIRPEGADFVTKQLYVPGTAILITRFLSSQGVGEVVDFMPIAEGPATDRHRLVRLVRVVRGELTFVLDCQPRFDYGRALHKTEITDNGVAFSSEDGMQLTLNIGRRPGVSAEDYAHVLAHGDGVRAVVKVTGGQSGAVVLETGTELTPRPV